MKRLTLFVLLLTSLITRAQYIPMTVEFSDSTSLKVVPAKCYTDSITIYGYFQGGTRPYQYKWTYISDNNTVVQDFQEATILPGWDYLFDHLDHFGVALTVPQPRVSNSLSWTGKWKLTVIDSKVTSPTDQHDTLNVTVNYKWPDQIILPMFVPVYQEAYNLDGSPVVFKPQNGLPPCDTCVGTYLLIKPQRGTPPYDILLIGADNLGNPVEHYGQNGMSLTITNLAQLHAGCYGIYVTDAAGCQEVFDYCYTTTGSEELSMNQTKLTRVINMLGQESMRIPNTVLILCYSDGSTEKVFITE